MKSTSVPVSVNSGALGPLRAACKRFANGEQLPDGLMSGLLPGAIARSWARSRDAGLMPGQPPEYELLGSAGGTPDDRRLRSCVIDEIEQLWDTFGGNDWTIFCINRKGTVIHARRSPGCDDNLILPIIAGRRILESHVGTTAPGCVLQEGVEVIVTGGQHYLNEFDRVSCVAVPLFGLRGEVIGALDITGTGQRDLSIVKEQFRLASLAAEQRIFATLRGCHLLRVHADPRWLETQLAGVLAVEEDGEIRAATRAACRILSLPRETSLPPVVLGELLDDSGGDLLGRILKPRGQPRRVSRADGTRLWVQYSRALLNRSTARRGSFQPEHVPSLRQVDASRGTTLEEQMLRAVLQAMRDHQGNVAAVARQLGVSRTTVYARVRQLRETGMLAGQGAAMAD